MKFAHKNTQPPKPLCSCMFMQYFQSFFYFARYTKCKALIQAQNIFVKYALS